MQENSEQLNSSLLLAKNLDPIVVGQTISDEHKQRWLNSSQKYKECGLCGEEPQAYPGD